MPPLTCFLAPPLAEAAEKAEKTVDDITCAGSSVSGGQIIFRIFDSFAVLTWRLRRSILLFLAVQFQRVKCSGCNCAYVRLRRFYLVFYFFLAIEFGHANLGQNGLFLRLGLLPKLIFKIAPSIHISIKPSLLYYFCLLSQLPIPCSILCVIFFFKTLAPPVGYCERDIIGATKHQG